MKGTSPAARGTIRVESIDVKPIGELGSAVSDAATTLRASRGRGRGRGRGRAGGRGGKRKRSGSEDEDDVGLALQTKSELHLCSAR